MGSRGASADGQRKQFFDWLKGEGGTSKGTPKPLDISKYAGMSMKEIEASIRDKSREQLFVFDKNGKLLEAYQGGKESVSFPTDVVNIEGAIVTHNHPKGAAGFGGTFSFADMNNATNSKWSQHRAVAAGQGEANYMLRATGKTNPQGFRNAINRKFKSLESQMRSTYDTTYNDMRKSGATVSTATHAARQKSVGILNRFYKNTASKYGYEYVTLKTVR